MNESIYNMLLTAPLPYMQTKWNSPKSSNKRTRSKYNFEEPVSLFFVPRRFENIFVVEVEVCWKQKKFYTHKKNKNY